MTLASVIAFVLTLFSRCFQIHFISLYIIRFECVSDDFFFSRFSLYTLRSFIGRKGRFLRWELLTVLNLARHVWILYYFNVKRCIAYSTLQSRKLWYFDRAIISYFSQYYNIPLYCVYGTKHYCITMHETPLYYLWMCFIIRTCY